MTCQPKLVLLLEDTLTPSREVRGRRQPRDTGRVDHDGLNKAQTTNYIDYSAQETWQKDSPQNFGRTSLTSPRMKTPYSTLACKPAWPIQPGPRTPSAVGPSGHPRTPSASSKDEAMQLRRSRRISPLFLGIGQCSYRFLTVDHRSVQDVAQARHRVSRPLSLL